MATHRSDFSTLAAEEIRRVDAAAGREREPTASNAARAGGEASAWLRRPPRDLIGLALSGGGIRSATFNLGVLQALNALGMLRLFDYLSTVSGGGYVGGFWTRWRSRAARPTLFPDGRAAADAAEPQEIRHLREFGNFLVPRMGIASFDTGRVLVTALGSTLPSLVVSLSLIALLLLGWHALAGGWAPAGPESGRFALLLLTGAALLGFELAWRRRERARVVDGLLAIGIALGLVALAAHLLGAPSGDLSPVADPGAGAARTGGTWDRAGLLAPAVVWLLPVGVLVALRALTSRTAEQARVIGLRAAVDRVQSRLIFLAAGWTVLAATWLAGGWLRAWVLAGGAEAKMIGIGGTVSALVTVFARLQRLAGVTGADATRAGLRARMRLASPRLLAYLVVGALFVAVAALLHQAAIAGWTGSVAAGAVAVVILALFLLDPNQVGLHAFYRDRLVRAYAGASNPGTRERTEVQPGDDELLAKLAGAADRPFHLICCTANDLAPFRGAGSLDRGGTSAVLSPIGCSVGSEWAPWGHYARPPTLGAAMTASGAAFNSLMGSHSASLGPAVTFLMATFNLRLGLWLPHPRTARRHLRLHRLLGGLPFFRELVSHASAEGVHVHLSDGGHFENTGVYELVRRHCRVILASDCGADPASGFDDLGNLLRRVRQDFGVDIRIDLSPLRPGPEGRSRQAMVAGDIHYPDGDTGILLVFKPALTADEPADVAQYAARSPAFPHETTGDQFYDEAQWEAYRRLGEHVVHTAFDGLDEALDRSAPDFALRLFGRARMEWLAQPRGPGDRVARFAEGVATLERLLGEPGCEALREEVHREVAEVERQERRIRVDGIVGEEGRIEAGGAAGGTSKDPRPGSLAPSLQALRRALLLMEETYLREDLERNADHPLYLGVQNYFARWACAPLLRTWWPLLRALHPQPFVRFVERTYGLRAGNPLEPGAIELLRPHGEGEPGFAMHCWRLERGEPPAEARVISYRLYLPRGPGGEPLGVQAAQILAHVCDGALVWDARDFYVPPGLWGVGIGGDVLRRLVGEQLAEEPISVLAVRVAFDPTDTGSGRRAANELQLYRSAGFLEAERRGDRVGTMNLFVPVPAEWDERPGEVWMLRAAGAGAEQPVG